MTTYKLLKGMQPADGSEAQIVAVVKDGIWSIPFDPANTDYANFKSEINADEAQLEDADGNLMSPEQAKAYVASLP